MISAGRIPYRSKGKFLYYPRGEKIKNYANYVRGIADSSQKGRKQVCQKMNSRVENDNRRVDSADKRVHPGNEKLYNFHRYTILKNRVEIRIGLQFSEAAEARKNRTLPTNSQGPVFDYIE